MLTINEKYNLALKARSYSYSPYSNFAVGAVALFKDGSYVLGCNVENASYGLSICAERNTLFKSISEGKDLKEVNEFLIIADCDRPVSPCGACRQVMSELLNKECMITLFNLKKDHRTFYLKDLLPYSFEQGDLSE